MTFERDPFVDKDYRKDFNTFVFWFFFRPWVISIDSETTLLFIYLDGGVPTKRSGCSETKDSTPDFVLKECVTYELNSVLHGEVRVWSIFQSDQKVDRHRGSLSFDSRRSHDLAQESRN